MYNELTKNDIKKMEEEIEYRKLVVRKEAIEAVKEARATTPTTHATTLAPLFPSQRARPSSISVQVR